MAALATPAIDRWQNDEAHRELAKKRSMQVIQTPSDTELSLSPVGVSREFGFLRDFWNLFYECIQSCQALDLIRDLASNSVDVIEPKRHTATVTFWMESYLNEVYIFQCRLLDLIKFIQRRYKSDADFTDFVVTVGDSLAEFVQEQLAPLIKDRGTHVHKRRHRRADPELAKLTLLDKMIDVLGHTELNATREQSRKDTASWLSTQVRHYSDLAWHLFDEVCRGFADGILLDIDRIIVPLHLKDNPRALLEILRPDT
ncbi:hypothetical protein [Paraburkholderia aspalathi]|uniref:Uncharacterized protein n=1 Tax=Paraburkholderia aspalathi TaxID=1324617 RepID=A0A1I6Y5E8_9BURK|nr:hypothetical protein [Paraburkholderia aspalathi]SFT45481.1 hypothetical protein SAMN05192563_1001317 [Paraburkholderia aspalathi]